MTRRSLSFGKKRWLFGAAVAATSFGGFAFACGSTGDGPGTADAAPSDGTTETGNPVDGALVETGGDAGGDSAKDVGTAQGDVTAGDAGEAGTTSCGDGGAGKLDPTFGDRGLLVPPLTGSGGAAVTYQPDGKLLVAGQHIDAFAVLRFTPNGTPDGAFGTGGLATATVGATRGIVRAMALQPDGKIVAVGQSRTNDDDMALARFLPSGTLDPSFGTGGVTVLDLGGTDDSAAALAIQNDGSILVSGTTAPKNTGNYDFVLLRYTSAGSLDATYAVGGKAQVDVRSSSDQLGALVRLPTGQAIVAGYSSGLGPGLRYDPSIVRFDKDGALDPTFGSGGKVVTDFGPPYPRIVNTIALDSNGMIIVGGGVGLGVNQDFAIHRYSTSGTLDTTLGAAGLVQTDFGGQEAVSSIGAARGGRIFAAGSMDGPSGRRVFVVASYLANGSLDPSFGVDGRAAIDFGDPLIPDPPGMFVEDCAVTLAASATTVVGGLSTTKFAIARYLR